MTGDYETRFIWDTLEKMDVAGLTPGPRELTAWTTFHELADRGTIPVIASNVALKGKSEGSAGGAGGGLVPIGVPYKIYAVNGLKVAAFSLLGGTEFAQVRPPEGVEFDFKDPFQVAGTLVPELRRKADLVVLLSEMAPGDTDRLLQAVPGIDVALYGQRPQFEQEAKKVGETVANQAGSRGQYLGQLVLIVDPEGKVVEFGSQNAPLDKAFPEVDTIVRLIEEANEKTKQLRTESRDKRQAEQQSKLSGERFLGDETCKRCHEKQFEQWAESPHSRALATLERPLEGHPRTDQCLSCHATGFAQTGGFLPDLSKPDHLPVTQPNLVNVQCEACHGRGTEHVRTGKAVVSEQTCRGCHTPEWSPNFDYEKALVAVRH